MLSLLSSVADLTKIEDEVEEGGTALSTSLPTPIATLSTSLPIPLGLSNSSKIATVNAQKSSSLKIQDKKKTLSTFAFPSLSNTFHQKNSKNALNKSSGHIEVTSHI